MTGGDEGVKILFVDDEENILRSLRRLMADESFEVFTASSGAEGIGILREHPDMAIIVSDQRMPEMNGAEFLEKSRVPAPDAIRMILTGYADINAAVNAINRGGACRYLNKPWRDDELLQTLKEASQRHLLMKENAKLNEIIRAKNRELEKWNSQLEAMVQEQTLDIQKRSEELGRLNERLNRNFKRTIEAFSNLVEMRDKTTSNHSKNVAALAIRTAASMSMTEQQKSDIFIAALLHDIGKIVIPDSILMKDPDALRDIERKKYEMHPVMGQATLETVGDFSEVGLYIRHHHERFDGSGFPDGLRRNDIPVGSRIIAMADAADRSANNAFSNVRNNYRKAISDIESSLDGRFDRAVFDHMKPVLLDKIRIEGARNLEGEVETAPENLKPGMILSRDVKSGSGTLLLARGMTLNRTAIMDLQLYYHVDPPGTGVFVLKKKG